jgi:hypothetical protein
MSIFKIKYTEVQERQWIINVESESLEEAEQLFTANNEDPWGMVECKKATWFWDSGDDGDALETLESNWEVEETE